jgi:hypothetical protein
MVTVMHSHVKQLHPDYVMESRDVDAQAGHNRHLYSREFRNKLQEIRKDGLSSYENP